MKIIVIGAGAWGTALAVSAARNPAGHQVTLWARDGAQAQAMAAQRENARYLPGIPLPRELHVRGGDLAELLQAVPRADLAIIATPVAGLRETLAGCAAWACRSAGCARASSRRRTRARRGPSA
jgi:glycerol-3-phosphate dehydrogenase (NAD(P)+)